MTHRIAAMLLALAVVVCGSAAFAQARSERDTTTTPITDTPLFQRVGEGPVVPNTVDPTLLGGVQLDIQPWRAQVFVDGARAGRVEEFRGYYQHLRLTAGWHEIAIVEPNRDTRIIEVLVSPGVVTTYRETLAWAYGR